MGGIDGLPYGFQNFLFSFIDTEDKNFPFIVKEKVLLNMLEIVDKIYPPLGSKFIGEGLNKRLGTKDLNLFECALEAIKQGKTKLEVMAMPEKSEWVYSLGPSFICSALAVEFLKQGGLFGDKEIVSQEFTPRDVLMLGIYDKEYYKRKPEECKKDSGDDNYCQFMGEIKVKFPEFNTIEPYSHMNERCSSIAPDYKREEGC